MNTVLKTLLIAVMILLSSLVVAAPSSDAIKFWTDFDESSDQSISHAPWQKILDSYLKTDDSSGVNLFDYDAVNKQGAENIASYLAVLQNTDPRVLNKKEQLAYWINFYNALTVKVVLDEYPIESIKDIRFLTSPFGPWDKDLVTVAGEDLSLNDIEHGILRPIWQDPRIHFSVNCASIGCPNLAAKAFTAENSDALMEQQTIAFINHKRGVEVVDNKMVLSSIFDWYGTDFGEGQAEVLAYIKRYYETSELSDLDLESTKVDYFYDWRLNEVK